MSDSKPTDPYRDFLEGIGKYSETGQDGQKKSAGLDDSRDHLSIGQRVRAVRLEKGLSVKDVGQRTGLDAHYMDDIESGRIAPPLGVLIKIAKALHMQLGRFISTGDIKPYTVVRKGERKVISRFTTSQDDQYGYTYESLAPDKRDRHMEPFMVTLLPSGGKTELSTHAGQEFIHVLKGAMEVLLDDARNILYPGDSIYYDSTIPHLVRCYGNEEAVILAVLYTED